jgi:hypothetical protein
VCENYLYLRFYAGVLKLALACAKAADPKDYGLAWYKDHYPPLGQEAASSDDDSVGAKAYETRLACYHYVLSAIAELLLAQAPAFECIPFEVRHSLCVVCVCVRVCPTFKKARSWC